MPQTRNHSKFHNINLNNVASHVHHVVNGVSGVVTLNRPQALNALNSDMVWSLREIFKSWKHDPAVGHVVLSSSSSRLFVQGEISGKYGTLFLLAITMRQKSFFEANI